MRKEHRLLFIFSEIHLCSIFIYFFWFSTLAIKDKTFRGWLYYEDGPLYFE
jgi:hypothetical protein